MTNLSYSILSLISLNDKLFNFEVPYLFSKEHILLLLISLTYIVALASIMRKKSYKVQRIVLIILMSICCLIFAGRTLWGWPGSKTTLLPLELCNINILITLIILIIQKQWLYNYLYYVSMLGAVISLTIYPTVHMNVNIFTQYMFWDYYIIHTNLVAVPTVIIACRWFKPSYKYLLKTFGLFIVVWFSIFIITTILRNFQPFATANYIYSYDAGTLPVLSQLYAIIPIPLIYQLPLLPVVYIIFVILGLPFITHEVIKVKGGKAIMSNEPLLYISSFNWVHILVIISMPVFIVLCTFLLMKKSQKTKDTVMWTILILMVLAYVLTFITDCLTKPDQIKYILGRLPLHLCGINVFFFPIVFGLRKIKNQKLYSWLVSYIYFIGSPAALMAILMPASDCINMNLLTYNCTTFFFKHVMLFCFPILLTTLRYYKPKFKDMFEAATGLIVLLCIMFIVDHIFMSIGGYEVNYFYVINAIGNPILEFFWNLVPVQLLYMFPMIILLIPVFTIYYLPFAIHHTVTPLIITYINFTNTLSVN